MDKLSKLIKIFGYLDYGVSAGLLAYGLGTQQWLYAAAGGLGLGVAYMKPAERLKRHLGAKFMRKPPPPYTGSALPDLSSTNLNLARQGPAAAPYRPRTRYTSSSYYIRYFDREAAVRDRIINPYDAVAVLQISGSRLRLGVRAEKIEPRTPRK